MGYTVNGRERTNKIRRVYDVWQIGVGAAYNDRVLGQNVGCAGVPYFRALQGEEPLAVRYFNMIVSSENGQEDEKAYEENWRESDSVKGKRWKRWRGRGRGGGGCAGDRATSAATAPGGQRSDWRHHLGGGRARWRSIDQRRASADQGWT